MNNSNTDFTNEFFTEEEKNNTFLNSELKKPNYWEIELENYNLKSKMAGIVNPGEFKKKLETINIYIALAVTVIVYLILFF